MTQAPPAHVALAWAREQAVPQAPQCSHEPLRVLVSQPLAALPSQSPHPVSQA